jgi:hypothetical protein
MKISSLNADHISFILAADKGIYWSSIQFNRHLINIRLVLILSPFLHISNHKDNIGVVVVNGHSNLVPLLHLPPLNENKSTTILLLPTLLWLNSGS